MVGMGQDTVLLCKAWCDPVDAARAGCHQDAGTSPGVTGSEDCAPAALSHIVLVREDVPRGISDQGVRQACVIGGCQVPASPIGWRVGFDPGRASPAEPRPLLSVLRI